MTVYLKGLNGFSRQIEHDVQSVTVDDKHIYIRYSNSIETIAVGVTYRTADCEIEHIEE